MLNTWQKKNINCAKNLFSSNCFILTGCNEEHVIQKNDSFDQKVKSTPSSPVIEKTGGKVKMDLFHNIIYSTIEDLNLVGGEEINITGDHITNKEIINTFPKI
jgi:hypothetical protein